MLTLGSTKISCVAQKTVVSQKKKIFQIEVNFAQQNYVGHKKNVLWQQKKLCDVPKKDSCWLNTLGVAERRNTCLQKMVPVAYKYMLSWLKVLCRTKNTLMLYKN